MYIEGNNKKYFTAKISPARSKSLMIASILFFVLALMFLLFTIVLSIYGGGEKVVFFGILLFLLMLLSGGGDLMNALAMKDVVLNIYDKGIVGTYMVMNPLSGLLTKTKAFDIEFGQITGMRISDMGELVVLSGAEEYVFGFSKEDSEKIYQAISKILSRRK